MEEGEKWSKNGRVRIMKQKWDGQRRNEGKGGSGRGRNGKAGGSRMFMEGRCGGE